MDCFFGKEENLKKLQSLQSCKVSNKKAKNECAGEFVVRNERATPAVGH